MPEVFARLAQAMARVITEGVWIALREDVIDGTLLLRFADDRFIRAEAAGRILALHDDSKERAQRLCDLMAFGFGYVEFHLRDRHVFRIDEHRTIRPKDPADRLATLIRQLGGLASSPPSSTIRAVPTVAEES